MAKILLVEGNEMDRDMLSLSSEIQSPQRHAKQEPYSGHDAVAVADAHARLSQMQLEQAQVLACSAPR